MPYQLFSFYKLPLQTNAEPMSALEALASSR